MLIAFPVGKKIISSQGRASLFPMARPNVCPQWQIIVAVHAEHEQLVKRYLPERLAGLDAPLRLVIITLFARKPVHANCGLKLFKRLPRLRPQPSRLRTADAGDY